MREYLAHYKTIKDLINRAPQTAQEWQDIKSNKPGLMLWKSHFTALWIVAVVVPFMFFIWRGIYLFFDVHHPLAGLLALCLGALSAVLAFYLIWEYAENVLVPQYWKENFNKGQGFSLDFNGTPTALIAKTLETAKRHSTTPAMSSLAADLVKCRHLDLPPQWWVTVEKSFHEFKDIKTDLSVSPEQKIDLLCSEILKKNQ